jgi:hypothetical protein
MQLTDEECWKNGAKKDAHSHGQQHLSHQYPFFVSPLPVQLLFQL